MQVRQLFLQHNLRSQDILLKTDDCVLGVLKSGKGADFVSLTYA